MGSGLGGKEPSVQGHHGAQQIGCEQEVQILGYCEVMVLPYRAGKPYQRGTAGAVSFQIPSPEEGLGVLTPSALPHVRVIASILGSRPGLHPAHPQLCLLQVLALGRP